MNNIKKKYLMQYKYYEFVTLNISVVLTKDL
jgi:hypothetical protein